jgi:hypothetical protein
MEDELDNSSNKRLIPFLRDLADSIEKRQLLPKQLQSIGEFFMTYQFQEQAVRDNNLDNEENTLEFSQEDLVKFLVMGWFIYCCILRGDSRIPDINSID